MKKRIPTKFLTMSLLLTCWLTVTASATGNIASSQIGLGLKKMAMDISSFLVVLSPIVGGAGAIYFMMRRGLADEQDGKMWTRRIHISIACGAGGFLVAGIIALVTSYF